MVSSEYLRDVQKEHIKGYIYLLFHRVKVACASKLTVIMMELAELRKIVPYSRATMYGGEPVLTEIVR